MIKKRPTMKDIAEEAGVSVATVSYVLNNSEKEKIGHETRLKILDAAKKLNYVPDLAARSLANKKSNLASIIINISSKSRKSKLHMCYDVANELERMLRKKGYDTIIITTSDIENGINIVSKRSLEIVFMIDVDNSNFSKLSNSYWAPIVLIDGIVDDPMFHRIYPNYEKAFLQGKEILGTEDVYLVLEDLNNKMLFQKMISGFDKDSVFVNAMGSDLREFIEKNRHRKGIVVGETLGVQVERFTDNKNIVVVSFSENSGLLMEDTKQVIISNKKKAIEAIRIMDKLLIFNSDEEKNTLIDPEEM